VTVDSAAFGRIHRPTACRLHFTAVKFVTLSADGDMRFLLCGIYLHDSTSIRLRFDHTTTIRRPALRPLAYLGVGCCTEA